MLTVSLTTAEMHGDKNTHTHTYIHTWDTGNRKPHCGVENHLDQGCESADHRAQVSFWFGSQANPGQQPPELG